jgi:membrane-associated phospholipid phosphatase
MQSVLAISGAQLTEPIVHVRTPARTVRGSEWVIVAFLIYAAGLAVILPVAPNVRNLVVVSNLAVILTYSALTHFGAGPRTLALGVIRDWLPLGVILLAYREMGWFAVPHQGHTLEANWVVWDRLILRGGAKAAIEAFGPLVPSVLEIAYALVYALAPFSIAMLYLYRRRDQVDRFLFIFAVGVLLCYAQFPFWPSEPPRIVFFGQDAPSTDTIFRRFNWWMLGNCGIHTSVFPSAHVGAAFSAAFGMWKTLPKHKWVSRFLLVMALLIAVATVYGRYHYVADAVAGIVMAIVALFLAVIWSGRQSRRSTASRRYSVGRLPELVTGGRVHAA